MVFQKVLAVLLLAFGFSLECWAASIRVSIEVLETSGPGMEFILAHTNGPDYQTGALTKRGKRTWAWDIGTPKSDVYFYWNYFHGTAEISVQLDDTVIFSGVCRGTYPDNCRLIDTCVKPRIYRKQLSPGLREPREEPVSILILP